MFVLFHSPQVIDISEMKYIKDSQMLRQLNLLRNPIQELPDYRLSILFRMKSLTDLDRHRVEVEEKVKVICLIPSDHTKTDTKSINQRVPCLIS